MTTIHNNEPIQNKKLTVQKPSTDTIIPEGLEQTTNKEKKEISNKIKAFFLKYLNNTHKVLPQSPQTKPTPNNDVNNQNQHLQIKHKDKHSKSKSPLNIAKKIVTQLDHAGHIAKKSVKEYNKSLKTSGTTADSYVAIGSTAVKGAETIVNAIKFGKGIKETHYETELYSKQINSLKSLLSQSVDPKEKSEVELKIKVLSKQKKWSQYKLGNKFINLFKSALKTGFAVGETVDKMKYLTEGAKELAKKSKHGVAKGISKIPIIELAWYSIKLPFNIFDLSKMSIIKNRLGNKNNVNLNKVQNFEINSLKTNNTQSCDISSIRKNLNRIAQKKVADRTKALTSTLAGLSMSIVTVATLSNPVGLALAGVSLGLGMGYMIYDKYRSSRHSKKIKINQQNLNTFINNAKTNSQYKNLNYQKLLTMDNNSLKKCWQNTITTPIKMVSRSGNLFPKYTQTELSSSNADFKQFKQMIQDLRKRDESRIELDLKNLFHKIETKQTNLQSEIEELTIQNTPKNTDKINTLKEELESAIEAKQSLVQWTASATFKKGSESEIELWLSGKMDDISYNNPLGIVFGIGDDHH
ncbi:hypothetical protein DID75_02025 [Candidatus Marinamargulisbacteria bacterium SCGC AG-410-N11]|nr:hypothetical protein DID75_02025 [Candidatus Marinamargulisbacteria bacterium SCGC AG-410-N11]